MCLCLSLSLSLSLSSSMFWLSIDCVCGQPPDCYPRRRRLVRLRPRSQPASQPWPRPCSFDVSIARRIRKAIFQRKGPPPSFLLSVYPFCQCQPVSTHTQARPGWPPPPFKLPQLPFFELSVLASSLLCFPPFLRVFTDKCCIHI